MNDKQMIGEVIRGFVNAYNSGDLEGVLGSYTDDLIKLRHGAPAETKPEVAKRVAAVFRDFISNVEVVNDEMIISGDVAVTRGKFRVGLTPRMGGEPQTIERRYLEIWRKENGRWLVARTMDNFS